MDSTAGLHAMMNLLLVPMWMVSGSLFPMAGASRRASGRSCWCYPLHRQRRMRCCGGYADSRYRRRIAGNGHTSFVVTVAFGSVLLAAVGSAGLLPEDLAQFGMKFVLPIAVLLALAGCRKVPPLPVLGQSPRLHVDGGSRPTLRPQITRRDKSGWPTSSTPPVPVRCPRMSPLMRPVQTASLMIPDAKPVSFTVDPEHDTPAVLTAYARRFKADPNAVALPDRPRAPRSIHLGARRVQIEQRRWQPESQHEAAVSAGSPIEDTGLLRDHR